LKIKLKGHYFDAIEVIKIDLQAWVPSQNTTSRMHFKNSRNAENCAYVQKETNLRTMVVSWPKASFFPKWQHQSQKL
jgi:hypothetical protein